MKEFLVGYTGFVGSNINDQHQFTKCFNSKNINEAFDLNPDLLVYCGIPAQKFIANANPDEDFKIILNAIENIKKINPKKLVLISTIDVYDNPVNVDEETMFEVSKDAYGKNRKYLEDWVINNIYDYHIIRLPGLYGKNLKKNFIYDLINIIPSMLKENKYEELLLQNSELAKYYFKIDNGFYKCRDLTNEEQKKLKKVFNDLGFSALNFTDSRGSFQFYNLTNLWGHILDVIKHDIKILNIATEPITIKELYYYLFAKDFNNEISNVIPNYNFKTKYAKVFNGHNGYIYDKDYVLEDIKKFVLERK